MGTTAQEVWEYATRSLTTQVALEATLTAIKGTGWSTETLKNIRDAIITVQADLDNPAQYMANVSALALEATLTAIKGSGWTDENIKEIVDLLESETFGLAVLEAYVDEIESLLKNATYGLEALKTLIDNLNDISVADIEGSTVLAKEATVVSKSNQTTADSIKAKTDLIPSDPASETNVDAVEAKVDTIDTVVDAIKLKTDNLPSDPASETNVDAVETKVDGVKTQTDKLPNLRFDMKYATNPVSENVASNASTSLTIGSVTPVFPTGTIRQKALLIAMLHVSEQAEAAHNIGIIIQGQKNGGGYSALFTAGVVPVSLPSAVGVMATFAVAIDVTSLVDTSNVQYDFKFIVDSDNAGSLNYTSNFVLTIMYSV